MPDEPTTLATQPIRGLSLELFTIADPAYRFPGALSHGHTKAFLVDEVDEFDERGRALYRRSAKTAAHLVGDHIADGFQLALLHAAVWSTPCTLKPWKLIEGRPHVATGCHFARAVVEVPDIPHPLANQYLRVVDYPIGAKDLRWQPVLA